MIKQHTYQCPKCWAKRTVSGPVPVKAKATGRRRNTTQCQRCGEMMKRMRL